MAGVALGPADLVAKPKKCDRVLKRRKVLRGQTSFLGHAIFQKRTVTTPPHAGIRECVGEGDDPRACSQSVSDGP